MTPCHSYDVLLKIKRLSEMQRLEILHRKRAVPGIKKVFLQILHEA